MYDGDRLGSCAPGKFSLFGDRAPIVNVRSPNRDKFCPGMIRLRTSLGVLWGADLDHRYKTASY